MVRRTPFRTLAALCFPVVAAAAIACGANDALVGGECATGYTPCGGRCVDTTRDDENCGGCGHACSSGDQCVASACVPRPDGGSLDATTDASLDAPADGFSDAEDDGESDGEIDPGRDARYPGNPDGPTDSGDAAEASADGSTTDGNVPDGTLGDANADTAQPDATADGSSDAGDDTSFDACAPPYNTVAQCGGCFTACVAPNPVCAPSDDDAGFACRPFCDAGYTNCSGTCVDTNADKSNCGACGNLCPSGFCSTSSCLGSVQGSVVYIGDDYEGVTKGTSEFQLLLNAISILPNTVPVKVLEYAAYADETVVSNVENNVAAATAAGSVTFSQVIVPTDVTSGLYDTVTGALLYSVLLVYDQRDGDQATLQALGASWAPALTEFTNLGGVVIFLDGDGARVYGHAGEMPVLATATTLLDVTSHSIVPANTPITVAGGDTVGNHVVSPFAAGQDTVSIVTDAESTSLTYVAVDDEDGGVGNPVVVHKVFN